MIKYRLDVQDDGSVKVVDTATNELIDEASADGAEYLQIGFIAGDYERIVEDGVTYFIKPTNWSEINAGADFEDAPAEMWISGVIGGSLGFWSGHLPDYQRLWRTCPGLDEENMIALATHHGYRHEVRDGTHWVIQDGGSDEE